MGRHNGVIAYPDKYASYAVSVRQYRTLQSRCLQCLSHDKPPCDLLMLSALIVTHKGLAPSGKERTLVVLPMKILFVFLNFSMSVQQVCAAHAGHTHP
jgi:hypothetical protein